MKVIATEIEEVKIIEPAVFGDERGHFYESWHKEKFQELGIDNDFVQDNHSRSVFGTLRGLHYQISQPQGKLVRVIVGEVFDVAVDIRKSSPSFGKWVGVKLSADNHRQLWVPPGFAHGFLVCSETAEFSYKCTDYYAHEHERSIVWNDPTINIQWPDLGLNTGPLLSGKDAEAPILANAEVYS